jgi:hypothetical protein
MFEDDPSHENLEDTVRLIVREIRRSFERLAQADLDLDAVAESIGVDLSRAREFADAAVGWLRAHSEDLGGDRPFWGGGPRDVAGYEDSPPAAGPHPFDLPTAEQGVALVALDSGRRTVEPGIDALAAGDKEPGFSDAPGLVDELRARDWVTADGEITLAGRHALRRWLLAAP